MFLQICFGVSSAQKRVFMLYYYNTACWLIPNFYVKVISNEKAM